MIFLHFPLFPFSIKAFYYSDNQDLTLPAPESVSGPFTREVISKGERNTDQDWL